MKSATSIRTDKTGARLMWYAPLALLALSGCEKRSANERDAPIVSVAAGDPSASKSGDGESGPRKSSSAALESRLASIDDAVGRWRLAANLRAAHAAAEEARNLIVGPNGLYFGDGDQDGKISGSSDIGLLPGRAGQVGLAKVTDGLCVTRDVLGGSWDDPERRWSILEAAIKAWTSSRNTMPTLPSHPQRIVGWATLALARDRLTEVREFGEHAQIHSDVSKAALNSCAG